MSRVTVTLCPAEREALVKLALTELRSPRDQVRHILRRELEQLGLLSSTDASSTAQAQERKQEVGHC
jgi:hypothetical protein